MTTVFVISDLHLGGRPRAVNGDDLGSSICTNYNYLAEFIDWLTSGEAANGSVELVLNGDIVDFLLDDDFDAGVRPKSWTPDQNEVIVKLEKIVARTREGGGNSPFDALKRFCNASLSKPYSLVLILGNHDVELSLPKVRQFLLEKILNANNAHCFASVGSGLSGRLS